MKRFGTFVDKKLYLIMFLITSLLFMGFCSYTSPLYYFDVSSDANSFFTVGKSLMHGIVPYKDLFEQKGPYIYLIHGLASLMTPYSLTGVFPFEVLSLFLTMYLVYKICRLYTSHYYSLVTALLAPFFQLMLPYFAQGDIVESMLFPALLSLIYLVLKADQVGFKISQKEWILQGFLVGVVFFTKFTLLGSWIVFYLVMFVYYLIKKRYRDVKHLVIWSFAGFVVAVLPWIIYFWVTGSLKDFIQVYLVDNITVYQSSFQSMANNASGSLNPLGKLFQSLANMGIFIIGNPVILVLALIGIGFTLFKWKGFNNSFGKILFFSCALGNGLVALYGHAIGHVYPYYNLTLMPYLLVPMAFVLIQVFKRFNFHNWFANKSIGVFLIFIISFVIVLAGNQNFTVSKIFPNNSSISLSKSKVKSEPAQIIFGKIMRENSSGRPTMLNYGSLDVGFYTTSGALPNTKYFENQNISYQFNPEILNNQLSVIKNRKVQWVVLNTLQGQSIQSWNGIGNSGIFGRIHVGNLTPATRGMSKMLLKNYRVVAIHSQRYEGINETFWLLKLK